MLQMSCNGLSPLLINFCKNWIPLVETKKTWDNMSFTKGKTVYTQLSFDLFLRCFTS